MWSTQISFLSFGKAKIETIIVIQLNRIQERERGGGGDRDSQTDRETDTETDRQTEGQTDTDRERGEGYLMLLMTDKTSDLPKSSLRHKTYYVFLLKAFINIIHVFWIQAAYTTVTPISPAQHPVPQ